MSIKLNTTDYAILGLLERRPWSAYELTQYMRVSSVKAIWPRAESRLYESPKKLVKAGMASSFKEGSEKKPRTIYTISDSGREALAEWLTEPGKALVLEHEAMLKLLLGDIDSGQQQQAMLSTISNQVEENCSEIEQAFEQLQQAECVGDGVSPARYAQHLLINSYIKEMIFAQRKWLEFAKDFQGQWDKCEESKKLQLVLNNYREQSPD